MLEMKTDACCGDLVKLNKAQIDQQLESIISNLKEGDELHLFCEVDFTSNLINLMNEKFAELPVKAKMMNQDESGMTIKVKYPKAGEGCCGSCS